MACVFYRTTSQADKNFRLSHAGLNNRFRGKDPVHVDRIYSLMYPEKDNSSYTEDYNRVNRRINVATSRYDIESRVNGLRHVQLVQQKKELDSI